MRFRFRPTRLVAPAAILAAGLFSSGYSSCAGGTGPLFVPLSITPKVVLLRASLSAKEDAVGIARVENGPDNPRFRTSVEYGKDATANWLTAAVSGTEVMVTASPGGQAIGTFLATVTVSETNSGGSASFQVEFTVIP